MNDACEAADAGRRPAAQDLAQVVKIQRIGERDVPAAPLHFAQFVDIYVRLRLLRFILRLGKIGSRKPIEIP